MSYLVLARKYRPRTFSEVCEQEVVVTTLRGAIAEGRIGHAYLLHGPRGTGKTTSARIFAKALNCDRGPTIEPCGTCERCRGIDQGNEVDVIEIDAASNRRIDDVRVLRDEVGYMPMKARFKVYIVDEVHMLTSEAFNAFLKTLEEPPAHVVFVFATTELEKVPETIRSRCQLLRLALLREDSIAARLATIFEREAIRAGEGVAAELARLARGSMRDALSLADQLLALGGEAPSVEDVHRLAGAGGAERVERVLDRLEARDKPGVLEALGQGEGGETLLIDGLLEHLRGALIALLCGAQAQLFQAEPTERERRAARGKRLGAECLGVWMSELLAARERVQSMPGQARLLFELTLLDLCRGTEFVSLSALEQRLYELESRLTEPRGPAALRSVPQAPLLAAVPPIDPRAAPPSATPVAVPPALAAADAVLTPAPRRAQPGRTEGPAEQPPTRPTPASLWDSLLAELSGTAARAAEVLGRRGKLADLATGTARIQLSKLKDEEREVALAENTRAACEAILARLCGKGVRVTLEDLSRRGPGDRDPFTRTVADLFQGQIEDN